MITFEFKQLLVVLENVMDQEMLQTEFMDCDGLSFLFEVLMRADSDAHLTSACRIIRKLCNHNQEVAGAADSVHFDLQGRLRHVLSIGNGEAKQAAAAALRVSLDPHFWYLSKGLIVNLLHFEFARVLSNRAWPGSVRTPHPSRSV